MHRIAPTILWITELSSPNINGAEVERSLIRPEPLTEKGELNKLRVCVDGIGVGNDLRKRSSRSNCAEKDLASKQTQKFKNNAFYEPVQFAYS